MLAETRCVSDSFSGSLCSWLGQIENLSYATLADTRLNHEITDLRPIVSLATSHQTQLREIIMRTCASIVPILLLNSLVCDQSTTDQKRTAPEIAEVTTAMKEFVDANEISGAVTLIGHRGKIVHLGAVGLADIDRSKPMKKNTMFSIASMTKPIVATGVMILQDDGKLNVDDKVSKYLPAFADMKLASGEVAAREITIRDCLTHTAGLTGSQIFDSSLRDAVDSLASRPLGYQPGQRWQYSPGLNVAGRIIEVVSEQQLQDFLRDRIFAPLKMNSTVFFPSDSQLKRLATLYGPSEDKQKLEAVGNRIANADGVQAPNPSGGLFSTARDMFRFYQMVLNDGKFRRQRVVSQAAMRQMTSPQTGELKTGFTPGNCWGLGWCIVREPQDVTGMLSSGTFGHGGAFGTQGWVDPKTETIYVLMIQRTKLPNSDASTIRKTFQQVGTDALLAEAVSYCSPGTSPVGLAESSSHTLRTGSSPQSSPPFPHGKRSYHFRIQGGNDTLTRTFTLLFKRRQRRTSNKLPACLLFGEFGEQMAELWDVDRREFRIESSSRPDR